MAQLDFEENISGGECNEEVSLNPIIVETTDVMTGDRNQSRFLYYQLKNLLITQLQKQNLLKNIQDLNKYLTLLNHV